MDDWRQGWAFTERERDREIERETETETERERMGERINKERDN